MAYTIPFDPATPTDADPVSSGDDRIREIKQALIERLGNLIVDLDADPWVLKPELFPDPPQDVVSGTLAARPNPPPQVNQLYQASDTDQLFVSRVSTEDPDTLAWYETKQDQVSEPVILAISAGEARFAPAGTETRAQRVRSAIAAARLGTSPIKVVYIPKTLWGYCGDIDFAGSMFDSTILLVREGALSAWYDPIAYGADASGTVNSRVSIDTCFLHASTTVIGMKMVAFTLPGEYLFTDDIDQRGCALWQAPDTALTGGGELIGDVAFKIPADPLPEPEPIDAAFTYNPAGSSGSRAVPVIIDKRLHLRINAATTDGSGILVIHMDDASFGGSYDLAKLHTIVASERGSLAGSIEANRVVVNAGAQTITLDLDGGSQTASWDLYLTFVV